MLGFLDMIRQGVPQVYFFTLFNSGGCELDELAEIRDLAGLTAFLNGQTCGRTA